MKSFKFTLALVAVALFAASAHAQNVINKGNQ